MFVHQSVKIVKRKICVQIIGARMKVLDVVISLNCDFLQKSEDLNFIISHIELSLTNDWGVTTVIVGR